MPTSITNTGNNTLSQSLKSILPNCSRVDALVGYFYFSGFRDIHNEVKDKQIRILVGMDIDKKIIDRVSTLKDLNFDSYTTDTKISSRSIVKENYIESFSKIFNDTDFFDNDESQRAFEIFLDKIEDGSLQIKKTPQANHSKFYIFHNKEEFSTNGITPGMVIIGSSNLTFSGLKGQGERNLILQEPHYYKEHSDDFEKFWNDPDNIVIADLDSSGTFIKEVKDKIWLYALPNPLLMYYKVLSEYFAVTEIENMKTPGHITGGKYSDFKYQKDAINLGIDRIKRFGGVIIADVVGLGKSIVASAIAHNLEYKTIIIAPPHLESQWKDYMSEFDFKGFVYTTGRVEEALQRHGDGDGKLLIILDEAHKYRNEDTDNYKLLHRLCAGNYVMALSATPFNNDPKDIYALIKLFSTPGQSTIRTVENLSMSFHMLFKRYKAVRRDIGKNIKENSDNSEIKNELSFIADELRKMIEPLIIRRSRLDLEEIEEYREDLKNQDVSFAKVRDPELLEYDLGNMLDLYINTLEKIAPEDKSTSFIGARYKVALYINQGSKFLEELVKQDDEDGMSSSEKLQRITQAQSNLAKFMRRLLVRRFESSIGAFKLSLSNMIKSSEKMLDWYENRQEVTIFKKGVLPEVDDLNDLDEKELEDVLNKLEDKGLIRIPASEIQPQFADHLRYDIQLLKTIESNWSKKIDDPKYEFFKQKITDSISENKNRKIVIFTEFSDTANYVFQRLQDDGFGRVFKYSSENSSNENKLIIKLNFDAGVDVSKQVNDFDIIIATDAISEGFNLHRAGTIINYDIPYNPTRVIQRVGRINRINRRVFDELYIYNFFPTVTGELETRTKAISTLKMNIIHALLGEDTKTLTSEEDLRNYFAKQYNEENIKNDSLSWDAPYRNTWLKIKDNKEIMEQILKIPHRTRIARKVKDVSGVVAFAKKGGNYVFAFGKTSEDVEIVSPQVALPLFNQVIALEESVQTTINFDLIYKLLKEQIFKDNTKMSVGAGRKQDALNRVKLLSEIYPQAKDLCIDVIRAIKDLDALPTGVLKEIVELKIDKSKPENAYIGLKELIPSKYLQSIFETADRANDDGQLIVLSEEFIL
ncbi:MAG: helicase-related protein [Candidatus Paceibacterota bacterium]